MKDSFEKQDFFFYLNPHLSKYSTNIANPAPHPYTNPVKSSLTFGYNTGFF
ncbi:hypothetical protein EXN66_Car002506 [Channa argus]|uniref:Uncharacterized protein n=1 Tax=Channa argus TaxID=215402 RepID=A0A6G1P9N7_CHAAH|nr:hypothetical protein EXN66_Car002506 [Channa argus]